MFRFLLPLLLLLATLPLRGEILGLWPGKGGTALQISGAVSRNLAKTDKNTDGYTVELTGELKAPKRLQFGFRKEYKLSGGTRYRLSVEMKAEPAIELSMGVMSAQSPYKAIPGSWKKCRLKPEYQIFSKEFVADKDYETAFNAPFLIAGKGQAGTRITVRKVSFETVEGSMLPLPATLQWTLFVKPGVSLEELQKLSAIPEKLGSAAGRKFTLGKTFAVIPGVPHGNDEAVLMTVIDSPADGKMQAGFSADWWAELYVNGFRFVSTLATGNMSHKFVPDDHVFNFNVRKGKNLLVAYVKSGQQGGKFAFGAVKYRHNLRRITEAVSGKEWRPTKMDDVEWNSGKVPPPPGVSVKQWKKEFLLAKRIDQFKILPGSALDMSQYVPHYDIDKLGFLVTGKDGHVVSSLDSSVRVKLRGFNDPGFLNDTRFFAMSHREIEELAEAIFRAGMNVIRFHSLETYLLGIHQNGLPVSRLRRKKASQVKYASSPEELEIDKAALDRVDYFTKCLRDRGIYVITDVARNKYGWTKAQLQDNDKEHFRYQLYADAPGKRAHFAAAFRFLMNHVNPYTGKKVKEDPQFMGITYYNEIEHIFSDKNLPVFDQMFQAWCKAGNHPVTKPFGRTLLLDQTPEGDAARSFLLEKIDALNDFLFDLARQENYRGFLTLYDMNVRHLCGWSRRNFPAVAMHTYHAHPGRKTKLVAPAGFKQNLRLGNWTRNWMVAIPQRSSIDAGRCYLAHASAARVFGKPFFITEYGHCNYNQFTQEGGIAMGACAALQDWDMLTPHANCVRLYYSPMGAGFEESNSMTQRAGRMLTAFAWQRGDVAPAKKTVNFNIPEKITRSGNILGSIGAGHNMLFMLTKIGSSYDGKKRGDFQFYPTQFTGVSYYGMYVMQEEDTVVQGKQLVKSVAALKKAKILPERNRTDVQQGIFESDTGEILADTRKHTLSVVTPRLESLVLKPGLKLRGKLLSVDAASIPVTVSAISIDGKTTLAQAKRLLLFVQTMSVAEHTVFNTENFDFEIDRGGLKTVERAGQFKIGLKTDLKTAPKFYALNPNGSREKELPVSFRNGKLTIDLDTSKLEYGTPFFELVY